MREKSKKEGRRREGKLRESEKERGGEKKEKEEEEGGKEEEVWRFSSYMHSLFLFTQ